MAFGKGRQDSDGLKGPEIWLLLPDTLDHDLAQRPPDQGLCSL